MRLPILKNLTVKKRKAVGSVSKCVMGDISIF